MAEPMTVHTSATDCVFTITIDHAPVNTIDPDTFFQLESAVEQFLSDVNARVAVIASANRGIFVSGADVHAFAGMIKTEKIGGFVLHGQALMNKISASSKPFIAAIDGLALGGGLELALACHLRIASERAKLGLPEVNLGIIPGWGGTQRLTQMVGRAKSMELILLGETISAQEALRLNLVNKIVPRDKVVEAAQELARKIASKSVLAVRAAMEAIRAATEMKTAEGYALEARLITKLLETDEAQARINAFLEKRPPE